MVQRSEWNGALGKRAAAGEASLTMTVANSTSGGSGAFRGVASNGQTYWIKVLNNGQSARVPANEQVVARVGRLIGAPTCAVATITIPEELAGTWTLNSGESLEAGIAHGSLAINDVSEAYARLRNRDDDDNLNRHCGIFALYDWCFGSDAQWLVGPDLSYHSHDHGHYFPCGPDWNSARLMESIDQPNEFPGEPSGITKAVAEVFASKLQTVSHEQIVAVMNCIPRTWPVSDQELEDLGFFLESRILSVAARLRARFVE